MKRLLICDLDNTLYDWVGYFVEAFYTMVAEAVLIMGCDQEQLLDDLRNVHRKHHDAEHPFALLETTIVQKLYGSKSPIERATILDPALHAFNSARKKHLKLYPYVRETLEDMKTQGVILVAHTEGKLYAVVDRLSRLELTPYFSRIYCRERSTSVHPLGKSAQDYLSHFPMEKVVELSHHQRKPNQDVLLEICEREGVEPHDAAYVGDSMVRDMMMAKKAAVTAIWAKYGTVFTAGSYDRLIRVSHWTPEDVARERQLSAEAANVRPDFVLAKHFGEIAEALTIEPVG